MSRRVADKSMDRTGALGFDERSRANRVHADSRLASSGCLGGVRPPPGRRRPTFRFLPQPSRDRRSRRAGIGAGPSIGDEVRLHRGGEGELPRTAAVSLSGRFAFRVLSLGSMGSLREKASRRAARGGSGGFAYGKPPDLRQHACAAGSSGEEDPGVAKAHRSLARDLVRAQSRLKSGTVRVGCRHRGLRSTAQRSEMRGRIGFRRALEGARRSSTSRSTRG